MRATLPTTAFLCALLALASGCKTKRPKPAPAPPVAVISMHAQPDVNPGPDGRPSPIVLRLYQLKADAAFGNSDGDRQMLEWTQSGGGARLMMLVHHDDAQREYAYGPKSKIGTFSDSLMAEAKTQTWHVISMKNDWRHVFAFEEEAKK